MRISPSFCVKRRKGKTKCRFCVYYIAFWAKWQAFFAFLMARRLPHPPSAPSPEGKVWCASEPQLPKKAMQRESRPAFPSGEGVAAATDEVGAARGHSMRERSTQSRGRVKGRSPLWGQGATPLGLPPISTRKQYESALNSIARKGVQRVEDPLAGRALPESRGSASGGHSFRMNSTPSVPGPQWQEMTPPARVSMTASK